MHPTYLRMFAVSRLVCARGSLPRAAHAECGVPGSIDSRRRCRASTCTSMSPADGNWPCCAAAPTVQLVWLGLAMLRLFRGIQTVSATLVASRPSRGMASGWTQRRQGGSQRGSFPCSTRLSRACIAAALVAGERLGHSQGGQCVLTDRVTFVCFCAASPAHLSDARGMCNCSTG